MGQEILSLSCLPIPPPAQEWLVPGGTYGSRTRLQGFADLCVTAPPTRRISPELTLLYLFFVIIASFLVIFNLNYKILLTLCVYSVIIIKVR